MKYLISLWINSESYEKAFIALFVFTHSIKLIQLTIEFLLLVLIQNAL